MSRRASLVIVLLLPIFANAESITPDDLVSVYKLAERVAPELLAARTSYLASEARGDQARSALLPQLSGSGSYGQTDEKIEGDLFGLRGLDGTASFNTTAGALTLTQLIFDRRRWLDTDVARQRSMISAAALESTRSKLLVAVPEAYFNLLQAEQDLRVAQSEEQAATEQFHQAKNRFKIGMVAQTAVKQAEAKQAQSEANTVVAANQLEVRRAELQRLTGKWHLSLARLGDRLRPAVPAPNDREHWIKRARSGNPDVRAAQIAVEVADLNVSRARGGYWPSLALEGTARYHDSDGGFSGASTQQSTGARLVVNVPLFESGRTTAEVREADYLLQSAQANRDASLSMAVLQATQSFLGVGAAIRKVQAFAKAREATRSALESTRAGQRLGTRTEADVLTAQEQSHRAERDYLAAVHEYVLNTLRLKAAAGEIKPADLADVNQWVE